MENEIENRYYDRSTDCDVNQVDMVFLNIKHLIKISGFRQDEIETAVELPCGYLDSAGGKTPDDIRESVLRIARLLNVSFNLIWHNSIFHFNEYEKYLVTIMEYLEHRQGSNHIACIRKSIWTNPIPVGSEVPKHELITYHECELEPGEAPKISEFSNPLYTKAYKPKFLYNCAEMADDWFKIALGENEEGDPIVLHIIKLKFTSERPKDEPKDEDHYDNDVKNYNYGRRDEYDEPWLFDSEYVEPDEDDSRYNNYSYDDDDYEYNDADNTFYMTELWLTCGKIKTCLWRASNGNDSTFALRLHSFYEKIKRMSGLGEARGTFGEWYEDREKGIMLCDKVMKDVFKFESVIYKPPIEAKGMEDDSCPF